MRHPEEKEMCQVLGNAGRFILAWESVGQVVSWSQLCQEDGGGTRRGVDTGPERHTRGG